MSEALRAAIGCQLGGAERRHGACGAGAVVGPLLDRSKIRTFADALITKSVMGATAAGGSSSDYAHASGGFDIYSRALARHWGRLIPGWNDH
jgi:hypothetical protein